MQIHYVRIITCKCAYYNVLIGHPISVDIAPGNFGGVERHGGHHRFGRLSLDIIGRLTEPHVVGRRPVTQLVDVCIRDPPRRPVPLDHALFWIVLPSAGDPRLGGVEPAGDACGRWAT